MKGLKLNKKHVLLFSKGDKKYIPLFSKGFQLPETVSNLRVDIWSRNLKGKSTEFTMK